MNIDFLKDYPELMKSSDLVALGLYRNTDAAYIARIRGNSPDYIKIGGIIKYPKSSVIKFMKERFISGSVSLKEEDGK